MSYFKKLDIKRKIALGFLAAMLILLIDGSFFIMTMASISNHVQIKDRINQLLSDTEAVKYAKNTFVLKRDRIYSESVFSKIMDMHEGIQWIQGHSNYRAEIDDQWVVVSSALNIFRDSFQEYVTLDDQSKALEDKASKTASQLLASLNDLDQKIQKYPASKNAPNAVVLSNKISEITKNIMKQTLDYQQNVWPTTLDNWRLQSDKVVEDTKQLMAYVPQDDLRMGAYHALLLAREYKDIFEQYYNFTLLQGKSEERMNSNSDIIESACRKTGEALIGDMDQTVKLAILKLVALVMASLMAFGLLAYGLAQKIASRLVHMIEMTEHLSKGDYTHRVTVENHDELDQLGAGLNALAENWLKTENQQFHELESLEDVVENKTSELERSEEQLKSARVKIIQNEKMAEIGRLTSQIAHDIHTPIMSIHSSLGNARYLLSHVTESLLKFAATMTLDEREVLGDLMALSESTFLVMSTREERLLKKTLSEEVHRLAIAHDDEVVECLVDMGIYSSEGIEAALKQPRILEMLELCRKIATLRRSIEAIDGSALRATKIIKALKTFSYVEQMDVMKEENLITSLETVLALYEHRFKAGVELERDFGKLPEVVCKIDEMNQVWMNLISNALEAMKGKGRLRIRARYDGLKVGFTFEDTGQGISEEVGDSIFDAFYTTNPSKDGHGLGLNLTKTIVEGHQGKVWFTSVPGHTVFYVELPIHPKI